MNRFAIPPDRTKYGFRELDVGQILYLQGDYRHIRIAANTYCRKHNKRILVQRIHNGVSIVERYK